MPIGSYCRPTVFTTHRTESLREAAQRMEKEGVGLLVVSDDGHPLGVLSDRDLALRADDPEAGGREVQDAMTRPALTVRQDDPLEKATQLMGEGGLRRLPVVDADGRTVGIIAADDLVGLLADEIAGLAAVARAQRPAAPASAAASPSRREARPVEHYAGEVVALRADAPVAAVVARMREHAVGAVVLMGDADEAVGIVTDRDVALRVIAFGRDPEVTPASAVMSAPLVAVQATEPVETIVEHMRTRGVRRVPVLRDTMPVGMVTYDDLLVALGEELRQIGRAAAREVAGEARLARLDRLRAEVGERIGEVTGRVHKVGSDALDTLNREVEALRDRLKRP